MEHSTRFDFTKASKSDAGTNGVRLQIGHRLMKGWMHGWMGTSRCFTARLEVGVDFYTGQDPKLSYRDNRAVGQ
jgi:hypothetical protein